MQNTPHNWSSHTLQCFPPVLLEYYQQNQVPKENKQQLKVVYEIAYCMILSQLTIRTSVIGYNLQNMVEEEYRNWNSMLSNEHELIEHFSMQGTPPLFLCIIWKMIIEQERINPLALKVIERIGAKSLANHLRKFCDFIVFEFANAGM